MGKPNGMKNSNHVNGNPGGGNSPEAFDKDTEVSLSTSRLRDEGNRLFQRRDHEGAMSKYAEALELLPRDHAEVPYLRSNVAACYMQMGLSEYPRAIRECGLALEVAPKYGKALLKRARCYEALNRLDLALRDVSSVLSDEPNNIMALEISERVRATLEKKGLKVNDSDGIELPHDYVEPRASSTKVGKDKNRKKKKKKKSNKASSDIAVEEKVVMEEKVSAINEVPKRNVKLILGEDIRWALLAENCSLMELREVVFDRFPRSRGVAIKYRDHEGDLVTITSDEDLRLAEESSDSQGSIRFYIVEVDPEKDPFLFGKVKSEDDLNKLSVGESSVVAEIKPVSCVEDWVIQFAHVFKNHVGFESDSYLNIHEIGMKLYSEAMEETVTSDEAQEIFDTAGDKFQELAALALFNWGNVHMSRARKKVYFGENDSSDSIMARIKSAYDWAQEEYLKAGMRYEESIKMKPDFYEGYLALGKQRFERAKLAWCYNIGNNHESESVDSAQIMKLYNDAEDNMEKGMRMWEEKEERRVREVTELNGVGTKIRDMGLDGFFNDVSAGEAAELASNVRSQVNLLWGTMLYERSIVEFKLGLPVWQECLEVAIEKFELAGASQTDIGVMVKNHCSNGTALEGLGFKIDEIVQAWNEMYEAKKLQNGVPSFRLEPLLRRRVSKLYHALEDA